MNDQIPEPDEGEAAAAGGIDQSGAREIAPELLTKPVTHAAYVLAQADRSTRQATRNLAAKIRGQLEQLAQRVQGEHELARLELQMSEARRRAAGRNTQEEDADV